MTQTPSNDEVVPNGTRVLIKAESFPQVEGTVEGFEPHNLTYPYDVLAPDIDPESIPMGRDEFEVLD